MRETWLSNAHFEWLIEGHLDEQKAIEIGKKTKALFQKGQSAAQQN